MMQAIAETVFDAVYLVTVLTLGISMLRKHNAERQYRLFGLMAVVLGAGDAFHLVPRAYALCTTGLEQHAAALGVGKWITSITMTPLSDAVETMYPLMQPSLSNLTDQILTAQSLEHLTYPEETRYTCQVLLTAVKKALKKAAPTV